MARKKTKKQKKSVKHSVVKSHQVKVSDQGGVSVRLENNSKTKIKTTTFSQSQVSLLKKDLLKTLITSLLVFGVLIVIYLNT